MSPMKTPPKAAMLEDATLSLSLTARRLGISQKALREKLGSGEIPFVEISGKLRIPILSVDAAVNAQQSPEADPQGFRSRDLDAPAPKPPRRKRSND